MTFNNEDVQEYWKRRDQEARTKQHEKEAALRRANWEFDRDTAQAQVWQELDRWSQNTGVKVPQSIRWSYPSYLVVATWTTDGREFSAMITDSGLHATLHSMDGSLLADTREQVASAIRQHDVGKRAVLEISRERKLRVAAAAEAEEKRKWNLRIIEMIAGAPLVAVGVWLAVTDVAALILYVIILGIIGYIVSKLNEDIPGE